VINGQLQAVAITAGEEIVFVRAATLPDRPHGMNHIPSRQIEPFRNPGLSRGAAIQFTAGFQQFGTSGPMNGSIHTAAAKKLLIGGINNRLNFKSRDVTLNNFYLFHYHNSSHRAVIKRRREPGINISGNRRVFKSSQNETRL
jgi:hypothetical protein